MTTAAARVTKRRITLIEDDADIAALVTGLADGHEIDVFDDGEAAVAALSTDLPIPQLILLDLDLPGMHGLEVLKRLRHQPRTRRVPIVIFTATERQPDEGYRLGANAWVKKSTNVDELESAIQALLAFWTQLNQPAGLVRA